MKQIRYFYAIGKNHALAKSLVYRFKWKTTRDEFVETHLAKTASSRDPRVRAALREEGPWPRGYRDD